MQTQDIMEKSSHNKKFRRTIKHIADFTKWSSSIGFTDFTQKQNYELLFLLMQLKKQISNSISSLYVPPTINRQEFQCEICCSVITLEPLQDIWECLGTHSHSSASADASNLKKTKNNELNCAALINHSSESSAQKSNIKETVRSELNCAELIDHSYSEAVFNETILEQELTVREINQTIDSEVDTESSSEVISQTCQRTRVLDNFSCVSKEEYDSNGSSIKSRSWYPRSLLDSDDVVGVSTSSVILQKTDANVDILDDDVETNSNYFDSMDLSKLTGNVPEIVQSEKKDFCFNFETRYGKKVESLLYPKLYNKFKLEGDHVLQRTGPERTVCLTCCCELLGRNSPGAILSHISGGRHSKNILATSKMKSIIQSYHDTFLRLDKQFQSHQIYFVPDDELYLLKCVACLKYVWSGDIEYHLISPLHKDKLKHLSTDSKLHSLFYFLKEHVEDCAITQPSKVNNETKENAKPKSPEHKIAKSVDESNITHRLPGRFNKHLKFLKPMQHIVSCTVCNGGNNIFNWQTIQLHLVQPSHLILTNTQPLNYIYHCDICDKRFHDEIAWILHQSHEFNRHSEAAQYKRNDPFTEYECSTCKLVLYGDSESVQNHKQSIPFKRQEKSKAVTLTEEIKQFFSSKAIIRENVRKLYDDAEATVAKKHLVHRCCEDIEKALDKKFPSCKAYPFGSRISGLGCSDSDLDIFVDTGLMYHGFHKQDEKDQCLLITNVLNLIRKRPEFTQINSIPTARTPIIKLKHRTTNLDCDISFVHGLSVENTKFLRFCFEYQPISQKLILFLKKWSHLCGLNDNITTYALAMLAIFYLQKKKYLLSVTTLMALNQKTISIGGWETIDYVLQKEDVQSYIEKFNGDIVELLSGFFKFYSEFNYKLNVVCPLLGNEISKCLFSSDLRGTALPKQMISYVRKINTERSPEYFRCLSHFCIQDPFDLSHNLTKACSLAVLNKFVRLCNLTHQMLTKLED